MAEEDFTQLRDAYSAAWEVRERTADDSPAILFNTLSARGLDEFSDPGPGRDLMQSFWQRGVTPDRLRAEFRRAVPGLAWTAVKGLAKSAVEVMGYLRGMEWESVDLSWLDLPDGHRKLSDHRHAHDLVLRWLHPWVDQVPLELRIDESADEVINRCLQLPSANRRDSSEAPVWLRLEAESPDAEVMVGRARIGWTSLPGPAWDDLKHEEQRGVYADGSVFLEGPPGRVRTELSCYVPRRR